MKMAHNAGERIFFYFHLSNDNRKSDRMEGYYE